MSGTPAAEGVLDRQGAAGVEVPAKRRAPPRLAGKRR
jgi:hypothetical protein